MIDKGGGGENSMEFIDIAHFFCWMSSLFYVLYLWLEGTCSDRTSPSALETQVASSRFNPAGSFENHNEGAELGIVSRGVVCTTDVITIDALKLFKKVVFCEVFLS